MYCLYERRNAYKHRKEGNCLSCLKFLKPTCQFKMPNMFVYEVHKRVSAYC